MKRFLVSKVFRLALPTSLLFSVTTLVHAAAIDVTAVVADIGAVLIPVGLIGSAVLLVIVAIKAFKWVRTAM